jgi:UDP-hydrolysing UDP-N-acetyl-D-glucosamine 2-epimerase
MRKVCVVTGYRSDYTKLRSVIDAIYLHEGLELQIVAFGAHLLSDCGNTVANIESDGYIINYKCSGSVEGYEPLVMSKSVGLSIIDLSSAYSHLQPDVVILVGDRYEILAAAVAASIGNIPVAHIQGGEISGTIDETIRHAITKFSHIHFPSTDLSKKIIQNMGEKSEHIFNVGCPAIDYIKDTKYVKIDKIKDIKKLDGASDLNIDFKQPYFILIQHPVTTEYDQAEKQMNITLNAIQRCGVQTILIYPNPDAGSVGMIRAIRKHSRVYGKKSVICNMYKNIPFLTYLNILKYTSCLIGNSSSGIREAHIFGVPVVNIGNRQSGRERTGNIIDTIHNEEKIISEIKNNYGNKFKDIANLYGEGNAGVKIADILYDIDIEYIIDKKLVLKEWL